MTDCFNSEPIMLRNPTSFSALEDEKVITIEKTWVGMQYSVL